VIDTGMLSRFIYYHSYILDSRKPSKKKSGAWSRLSDKLPPYVTTQNCISFLSYLLGAGPAATLERGTNGGTEEGRICVRKP